MSGELTGQSYREKALGRLTARDGYFGIALERSVAERALLVVGQLVVEALENGYHPQNPSPAHPSDYIAGRFELYEELPDV